MIYAKPLHSNTQNHSFHWFHGANKAKKKDRKSINRHKVVLTKASSPRYGLKVFHKNRATRPYVYLLDIRSSLWT